MSEGATTPSQGSWYVQEQDTSRRTGAKSWTARNAGAPTKDPDVNEAEAISLVLADEVGWPIMGVSGETEVNGDNSSSVSW